MHPIPELIPMLKQLRLSGVLDSLELRNRQAIEEKLAYTDFLAMLIQDEVARRTQKKLITAVRRANFRNHKTIEEFDFSFNPKINRSLVIDLATCRFIEEKACVLIAGPCGTGKSHLAQALGHSALRLGYDVLFLSQTKMSGQLNIARAINTYDRRMEALIKVDLLIIDDFGRQLMSPRDLLNRWIVPLDRRVDYLTLRYGVKFQIPFETMVVFSTNLDPSDLADEAFLRRIHNKIYVEAVDPATFDQIFERVVQAKDLQAEPESAEYLRKVCMREGRTELRACYPLDICNILNAIGRYEKRPAVMTKSELERAASLYFARS